MEWMQWKRIFSVTICSSLAVTSSPRRLEARTSDKVRQSTEKTDLTGLSAFLSNTRCANLSDLVLNEVFALVYSGGDE